MSPHDLVAPFAVPSSNLEVEKRASCLTKRILHAKDSVEQAARIREIAAVRRAGSRYDLTKASRPGRVVLEVFMVPVLRCAVAIGVIYALSPVRDPVPSLQAPREALAGVDAATRALSSLPEPARRAVIEEAARQARSKAETALHSVGAAVR
jgi:hypothetical protein